MNLSPFNHTSSCSLWFVVIFFLGYLGCLGIWGCSSFVSGERSRKKADKIAKENSLQKFYISTGKFTLTAYGKMKNPLFPIVIYIEGDGFAWKNKWEASSDPTPLDPLVLRLAVLDPRPNVLYLARPCQYTPDEYWAACEQSLWTKRRFTGEVVQSLLKAIEIILRTKQKIELVGYSGGGHLAVVIASQLRKKVLSLRTLAGNLDHPTFTNFHQVGPLIEAPSALYYAPILTHLPQRHYWGDQDQIVPLVIVDNFFQEIRRVRGLGYGECASLKIVTGVGHASGWEEAWPELLKDSLKLSQCPTQIE